MSNVMSLKAKIRNTAKKKKLPAQVILQNYMFERFLVRLAASDHSERFVLKGGMLVAAIVGLDNRATMDLDTTLKNLPLDPAVIEKTLSEICAIDADDDIYFEVGRIIPIRDDDIYGGYRASLTAKLEHMLTPLSIDISTGDIITPSAVCYELPQIFDDQKTYNLHGYNIETILAEKIETVLRRGVFNTRPRDFYDIHILTRTQKFDKTVFRNALTATAEHRGTAKQISDVELILKNIEESSDLRAMWDKYKKQFAYASDISFDEIIKSVKSLLE